MMNDNYLEHHGILGQKWGVRRYQNPDGTLTPEGKERYFKILSKDKFHRNLLESNNKDRSEHTHKTIDSIKSGTKLYRVSSSNEKIDNKRKYVSLTEDDRARYFEYAINGYLGDDVRTEYTYKAKKKLRVASGKEVVDHILNEYGDKTITGVRFKDYKGNVRKIYNKLEDSPLPDTSKKRIIGRTVKDAFSVLDSFNDVPPVLGKIKGSKKDRKFVKNVTSTIEDVGNQVSEALAIPLFKNKKMSSDVMDHFSKLGYDAIVDAEDWYTGAAELPLIILNPEKSISIYEKREF